MSCPNHKQKLHAVFSDVGIPTMGAVDIFICYAYNDFKM